MTTDWKALCAALIEEAPYESPTTCLARAALSQPESKGPTLEEINDLFWKHSSEIGPSVGVGLAHEDAPALICEALARWGRPAIQPEPEEPTDSESTKDKINNSLMKFNYEKTSNHSDN